MSKPPKKVSGRNEQPPTDLIDVRSIFERLGSTAKEVAALRTVIERFGGLELIDTGSSDNPAFSESNLLRTIERAESRLAHLPPKEQLEDLAQRLLNCTSEKSSQQAMGFLIGAMLDGFKAKLSESSDNFVAALLLSIDEEPNYDEFGNLKGRTCPQSNGWSAEVVATAVRMAWQAGPFQPSISEFLEFLRLASIRYHQSLRSVQRLLDIRRDAEFALSVCRPSVKNGLDLDDEVSFD